MLPAWMQKSDYKNVTQQTRVDLVQLNSLIHGLGRQVDDSDKDAPLMKTDEEEQCLSELVLRVNERLHNYAGI